MYQYRLMTTDDLELMVEYQKLKRELEPGVFPDFKEEEFRKSFLNFPIEESARNWVILVLHEEKIIGRVDLIIDFSFMDYDSVGYIDWVYVLKNYRGQRIAKELFKQAEIIMNEHDVDYYYLFSATNDEAVRFYSSTDLEMEQITRGKKKLRGTYENE